MNVIKTIPYPSLTSVLSNDKRLIAQSVGKRTVIHEITGNELTKKLVINTKQDAISLSFSHNNQLLALGRYYAFELYRLDSGERIAYKKMADDVRVQFINNNQIVFYENGFTHTPVITVCDMIDNQYHTVKEKNMFVHGIFPIRCTSGLLTAYDKYNKTTDMSDYFLSCINFEKGYANTFLCAFPKEFAIMKCMSYADEIDKCFLLTNQNGNSEIYIYDLKTNTFHSIYISTLSGKQRGWGGIGIAVSEDGKYAVVYNNQILELVNLVSNKKEMEIEREHISSVLFLDHSHFIIGTWQQMEIVEIG